ncbi:MAG TPA: cytochrome P450, partial [Acidimicrobiales bacterium]|nr:cytochrome P450 [Acidimicrobiales bacterium]
MTDTQVFFNPLDPDVRANPYPHYAQLRAADPVHRSPFGLIVLTRYDDCAKVLRDARFSADMEANASTDQIGLFGNQEQAEARDEGFNESLLNLDPPKHTRVRGLAARAFTPKAIDAWRPRVVEMVDEILDGIDREGGCDLVSTLAFPLPFLVISELLGMPTEERDQLRAWSQAITLTLEPMITDDDRAAATEATTHMREFVEVVIDERRKAPREDDLLSALIAAEEEGERLSTNELVAMVLLLFVAGHETTVNLIGNGTRLMLEHPDVLERFRADLSLDATTVDELLRMDGPVQFTARAVLEEVDFGGDVVEKGAVVMPVLGAANHDPTHFADPDTLMIDRPNAASHLAFGSGIHFCLGASLARLEGQLAIGRLLRRFPTLECA